jgi:hypothetical protein
MMLDFDIFDVRAAVLLLGTRDGKGGAQCGASPNGNFHFFSLGNIRYDRSVATL